jgi:N4-acetylcytidine amidohydrolase
MMFKKTMIEKILAGEKTMTCRRTKLYKPGTVTNLMCDKDYSKLTGKYIKITAVTRRKLKDFSDTEARKEGFNDMSEFRNYWGQNICYWTPEQVVWLHEFELIQR